MQPQLLESDAPDLDEDALIGEAAPATGWRSWSRRTQVLAAVGSGLAVCLAIAMWQVNRSESRVPLAVPAASAATAGQAVEQAGIAVEWREGHPWVAASQAAPAALVAAESLGANRTRHTSAGVAEDDHVFLSSEASRARRLAATMAALEQMIESQNGVRSARVVLAEGARPGAPGAAYSGPSGVATVAMAEGTMSQDMVDAVAALVAGALPGLTPERVAVIDANAQRQRTARSPDARAAAEVRAERERVLSDRVKAAIPPAREAAVSLDERTGAAHARVVLSATHVERLLAESRLPADVALATEEARVVSVAESLLPLGSAGEFPSVVVCAEQGPAMSVREESTPAAGEAGEPVRAAIERERTLALGPSAGAAGAWDAGTLGLLITAIAAVAAAVLYAQRRNGQRMTPALASGALRLGGSGFSEVAVQRGVSDADEDHADVDSADSGVDAREASDAVRADPSAAASVVRTWLDGGYEARAAHLVVALDSGAAGALLRALPAPQVQRITVALATLGTPSARHLRAASHELVDELALARDSGFAGDERPA
jgi:hypothetical protein